MTTFHESKYFQGLEADCRGFVRHRQQPVAGGPEHGTMFLQVGGDGLNMNIFGCYSAQVFGA
jgi:hypothetical protein